MHDHMGVQAMSAWERAGHPRIVPLDEEDVILLRQEERRVDADAREPVELLRIILGVNHRQ